MDSQPTQTTTSSRIGREWDFKATGRLQGKVLDGGQGTRYEYITIEIGGIPPGWELVPIWGMIPGFPGSWRKTGNKIELGVGESPYNVVRFKLRRKLPEKAPREKPKPRKREDLGIF